MVGEVVSHLKTPKLGSTAEWRWMDGAASKPLLAGGQSVAGAWWGGSLLRNVVFHHSNDWHPREQREEDWPVLIIWKLLAQLKVFNKLNISPYLIIPLPLTFRVLENKLW